MLDWSSRTRSSSCCSGLVEAANIATEGDSRRTAMTDAEGRRPITTAQPGRPHLKSAKTPRKAACVKKSLWGYKRRKNYQSAALVQIHHTLHFCLILYYHRTGTMGYAINWTLSFPSRYRCACWQFTAPPAPGRPPTSDSGSSQAVLDEDAERPARLEALARRHLEAALHLRRKQGPPRFGQNQARIAPSTLHRRQRMHGAALNYCRQPRPIRRSDSAKAGRPYLA